MRSRQNTLPEIMMKDDVRAVCATVAIVFSTLCAVGCGVKAPERVVDWCEKNDCPDCASDEECRMTGNTCEETAYCAHEEGEVVTTLIGCSPSLEYQMPPDSDCSCVERRCVSQ